MKKIVLAAGFGLLAMLAQSAAADWALNMPQGVTKISHEVYDLHMLVMYICTGIGVVVFGAMFYSMLKHRKSQGYKAADFHESTTVEIIWTAIPFVILVLMAIPAAKTLIAMEDTGNADMTVKITGYQWKWRYDYLDGDGKGIGFFSTLSTPRDQIEGKEEKGENYLLEVDHPLVVPVNRKVRFVMTSNDVIHAWWVPDLAIKKDAVPGFINEMWTVIDEPGTYRGQCAELCGKDHGFMPIVVVALGEQDYLNWVEEQGAAKAGAKASANKAWSKDELLAQGEKVYNSNCAACHQANGQGIPGTFPAIAGSPVATGDVKGHISTVMGGRPGTAMAAFAPQLNDVDLASVITYQRNAFGNNTGDIVQPTQIKASR